MSPGATYPWKRYWVKQGENPLMDDGLFIEPANRRRWYGPESNGLSLLELNNVPCLILLGDVGMGKSTTVREESQRLKNHLHGQKHIVIYHDLKRLSESLIQRQIFEKPEIEGWMRNEHSLTIFLDSLDECWRRIDALELLLVDEFERRIRSAQSVGPLFLRLTCRSAEWRGDAGKTLERLFPKRTETNPPVQVFVLAPLSRNNVAEAAKSNDLDPDRLIQRIADKEAQALASHPITFEMLLELYRSSGDFPKSRVELYQDGCLKLCADQHIVAGSVQSRKTTFQQRFAIASRLAALSVFTNKFLLNGDFERSLMRCDVLETSEIAGYTDELIGGERIVVDRDTIAETLQTGLFAEKIEGCQTWRHQSYAEFLAAFYLKRRQLSDPQIASILVDSNDNSRRIVPQLEETACWTAEINVSAFQSLAKTNADVFLRCDSTYWNDDQRALLVEGYLKLIRAHEAAELDWQLKYRLARLAHPNLTTQLQSRILDRNENPLVREAAIDIAGYCQVEGLKRDLIQVYLDNSDIYRVRKHAAVALERTADDQTRELLKQKGQPNWDGDSDDEFKGYYLQIMWPSHLGIDELLPLLTRPKRNNYTGSYKMFFQYELPKSASTTDLPKLLHWIRETKVSFDILSPFGFLASKIFVRALTDINVSSVREAILELLRFDDNQLYYIFRGGTEPVEVSPEVRVLFWSAIVNSSLDIQHIVNYGDLHRGNILSSTDLPRFIAEYQKATDENVRVRWRELVFLVFSIDDVTAINLLSDLACFDESIAQNLAAQTSCPLLPDEHNWMKKGFLQQQEREQKLRKKRPSLIDELIRALEIFESGKLHAFWTVVDLLDRDPEDPERPIVWAIRLSEGKAWSALNRDVKDRILRGITVYLRSQPIDEKQVWEGGSVIYRAYHITPAILVLLFEEDRQAFDALTPEDWDKWIGVFFAYGLNRNGSREEAYKAILSSGYEKAKPGFLAALRRQLAERVNNDSERQIIWSLKEIWSNDIKQIFVELVEKTALSRTAAQDIIQLIISQEPHEGENLLESFIKKENTSAICSVYFPVALAIKLTNFPQSFAAGFVETIQHDPALGRAVIPRLLRQSHQPSNWLSKIPPAQLLHFWEWLNQQYPGDPYEKDNEGGSITIAHDIYHFRNGVFETIARLGTPDACEAMAEFMERKPEDFWLGNVLADMRKANHRRSWTRPSPSALMQLFSKTDKRLVRTSGDLQELIVESLHRFEAQLRGNPPSTELWNEVTSGKEKHLQPKDEMNLSDRLKRFLENDLQNHGIIADREVQIRPRFENDPAQLVDLLVRAIPFDDNGLPGSPVNVVVEVKCAWNNGVLLDMERQLYDRYLNSSEMHFGIFAVAYFTCDAWNWPNDNRKTRGESETPIADLEKALSTQATSLSNSKKRITSVMIDARLGLKQ